MIIIDDFKEKRLIIARYFILKKNSGESFTEKDVFCMWKSYFHKDYGISKYRTFKFVDGELILNHKGHVSAKCIQEYNDSWNRCYKWLSEYIENNDIEKFHADIQKLRKRQERVLKYTARNIGCSSKLIEAHDNRLAVYAVYGKNYRTTGSYSRLMKKIKE